MWVQLGPYKVKVFLAEPKDASLRNAAHASLSPVPQQLHLPENLYDAAPLPPAMGPGRPMNSGLGNDLLAMLGESAAFMGGPYAMPSSGGSMAPHSGASAPAAPQSGGNMWSPPHQASGGMGAGATGQGAVHDSPGLHVSHQLLMAQQDARNRNQPAASQGQGPILDSSTAGQQLAQLFAKLQTHDDSSQSSSQRNMPSTHSPAYRMMPPASQLGDSSGRRMWPDASPHMHGGGLGHQNPYSGIGMLGEGLLGSNSTHTTGPGLGSGGVIGSTGGSFTGQTGGYASPHTHGVAAYPERFPSRTLSGGMGFASDGVPTSGGAPDNILGYSGWQNPPGSGRTNSPARSGGPGGSGHGPAPEVSMQRLFVVVSKSATEEQIAKQFKKFGGMEYCNLKRDKKTGQSKGYCFVNYSTAESAAAAMKALNGMEFPTGSGRNMKVRLLSSAAVFALR